MSTRKILTLVSVAALLFSPAAFSFDPTSDANDSPIRLLGEKLDSGLGDLPSNYAAESFQHGYQVAGEKLDSGLGDLPQTYAAAEFQRHRVAGEAMDSGLGDLSPNYTAGEFQRYRVAGETLDSGLGDLPPTYTAAEFQNPNSSVFAANSF